MLLARRICNSWCRQGILKGKNFEGSYLSLENVLPSRNGVRLIRKGRKYNSSLHSIPFEEFNGPGNVSPSKIMKALVFTGAFTVGSFAAATIMEYENTRKMMIDRAKQAKLAWFTKRYQNDNSWDQLKRDIKMHWDRLTPGEKIFVPICALNVLVFGMWRIPRLRPTMLTYFSSNPGSRVICWPMFLSTFSHYSAFHLFANMYVLHSFSNAAVLAMGKEQFVGMYLSAGVIASMASVIYKAMTAQAGMSIGASGAIMAVLAYVCSQYPDTRLSILFLPMLTFSAGSAIKFIMGIDLAGCLLGWKFFDHAAHLGGALFGIFWAYYGPELWEHRLPLLNFYHDMRKQK